MDDRIRRSRRAGQEPRSSVTIERGRCGRTRQLEHSGGDPLAVIGRTRGRSLRGRWYVGDLISGAVNPPDRSKLRCTVRSSELQLKLSGGWRIIESTTNRSHDEV